MKSTMKKILALMFALVLTVFTFLPQWQVQATGLGGAAPQLPGYVMYKIDSNSLKNGEYTDGKLKVKVSFKGDGKEQKSVDWSSNLKVYKVYVKGGNGGSWYETLQGSVEGKTLVAPQQKGISHIAFYYKASAELPTTTPVKVESKGDKDKDKEEKEKSEHKEKHINKVQVLINGNIVAVEDAKLILKNNTKLECKTKGKLLEFLNTNKDYKVEDVTAIEVKVKGKTKVFKIAELNKDLLAYTAGVYTIKLNCNESDFRTTIPTPVPTVPSTSLIKNIHVKLSTCDGVVEKLHLVLKGNKKVEFKNSGKLLEYLYASAGLKLEDIEGLEVKVKGKYKLYKKEELKKFMVVSNGMLKIDMKCDSATPTVPAVSLFKNIHVKVSGCDGVVEKLHLVLKGNKKVEFKNSGKLLEYLYASNGVKLEDIEGLEVKVKGKYKLFKKEDLKKYMVVSNGMLMIDLKCETGSVTVPVIPEMVEKISLKLGNCAGLAEKVQLVMSDDSVIDFKTNGSLVEFLYAGDKIKFKDMVALKVKMNGKTKLYRLCDLKNESLVVVNGALFMNLKCEDQATMPALLTKIQVMLNGCLGLADIDLVMKDNKKIRFQATETQLKYVLDNAGLKIEDLVGIEVKVNGNTKFYNLTELAAGTVVSGTTAMINVNCVTLPDSGSVTPPGNGGGTTTPPVNGTILAKIQLVITGCIGLFDGVTLNLKDGSKVDFTKAETLLNFMIENGQIKYEDIVSVEIKANGTSKVYGLNEIETALGTNNVLMLKLKCSSAQIPTPGGETGSTPPTQDNSGPIVIGDGSTPGGPGTGTGSDQPPVTGTSPVTGTDPSTGEKPATGTDPTAGTNPDSSAAPGTGVAGVNVKDPQTPGGAGGDSSEEQPWYGSVLPQTGESSPIGFYAAGLILAAAGAALFRNRKLKTE